MQQHSKLSWLLAVVSSAVACNAIFGLEELEKAPPGGGDDSGAGEGSGGTASGGRGGSAGSSRGGTPNGGSSGSTSGTAGSTSGSAGESGGGMGGGGDGDCTEGDEARCDAIDPTTIGNCAAGTVTCQANGTWGPCSVTPASDDACDETGDDANCDGTPNGGCPCVTGEMRECGPNTEVGI
jgi:hypothetical protein